MVEEFASILRFWMDRGADGFRIDVSDALIKDDAFPDTATGEPIIPKDDDSPVHDVYREFRRVMDAYPGDRMAVIETGQRTTSWPCSSGPTRCTWPSTSGSCTPASTAPGCGRQSTPPWRPTPASGRRRRG